MEIKRVILFSSAIVMMSFMSFAQNGKYGASSEDSVKCVESLSIYSDFIKQKDYRGAYSYLKVPMQICPKSSLKMYVDGVKIFKNLAKGETDEAKKKVYIDSLLLLHDLRIQNFGKEGFVLGRKGAYMYKYKTPSLEGAYETLEKSVQLQGNKSEAATLIYYFRAAVKLEKKGTKEKAEIVELFTKCSDIIDFNLKSLKEGDKKLAGYMKAQENIEKLGAPYLSCEAIEGIAEGKFEDKKDDAAWLAKMSKLLEKKKCTESATFFKVANRQHELNPTAASAKNMGIMSLGKKKYSESVAFFTQSIELLGDSDNNTKADLEFYMAKSYFAQGQYSAARTHCLKAANYRSGWGEPYMLIGDMYAASIKKCDDPKDVALKAVYWVAVDKYIKAKNVDASVTGAANKKIASYSQHFPAKADAFFYTVNAGDSYTVGCWINETTKARVK